MTLKLSILEGNIFINFSLTMSRSTLDVSQVLSISVTISDILVQSLQSTLANFKCQTTNQLHMA